MSASAWRIPVSAALGFIVFVAIGCAALMSATTLWAQVIATLTFTALLIATIGAIEGPQRGFWRGFAIFGWVYLILSSGPWFIEHVRPVLLSHRFLEELFLRTAAERGVQVMVAHDFGPFQGPLAFATWEPEYVRFHSIGHNLFCLVHALFGGFVGRYFAARRQGRLARSPAVPAAPALEADEEPTRN